MSTLAVNTIQAETGSTVTVASGHSLDASNGLATPAGHVVQSVLWKITPIDKSTSGSWASGTSPTLANTYEVENYNFTKKHSNSKVHVTVSGHVDHGSAGGGSPAIIALIEKNGTGGSNETFMGAAYRHVRVNDNEPLPYTFCGEDAVAGTSKIYSLRCHYSGPNMRIGRSSTNNPAHVFTILLQEIAG